MLGNVDNNPLERLFMKFLNDQMSCEHYIISSRSALNFLPISAHRPGLRPPVTPTKG